MLVEDTMARLETSKTGATPRPTNGGGHGAGDSKPPVNLTITTCMLNLENMLRAMGGHIDKRWLAEPGWDGLPDIIINHISTLAAKPYIIQYKNQLRWELEQADAYLNPQPEQQLIGPCPNDDTPLTAAEDEQETRCTTCGETYNITLYRLGRILQALGDDGTPIRASEAVRRFTNAGIPLTPMTIKNLVIRGKLHPVSIDEHQRRLYSIPDLYTLITGTYSQ
jgi:hypothetical protein